MKNGFGGKSNLAVIAPSEWISEKAKESSTLGQSPITKIYNSIDELYVQNLPIKSVRKSSFIVTFVAQDLFNEYKGIYTLLECMKIYKKDFIEQEIKFQFVGSGERIVDQELIYRQSSRISESEMREIYLDSDLLIVPSSADNSPNIIFEALACGIPFVGSDRGGIPELCTIFGMETFKYGDAASMYKAIIQQKSKKTDQIQLRKKALSLTHPEIVAKLHIELYKSKLTSAN
jgi:glycosyltransferase involved in cell wall biosynthesis